MLKFTSAALTISTGGGFRSTIRRVPARTYSLRVAGIALSTRQAVSPIHRSVAVPKSSGRSSAAIADRPNASPVAPSTKVTSIVTSQHPN
ncbi:MAG TPA: hypothetical protein VGM10_06580 [Actinocrinis sp.]|jgi:hypothetical protein